MNNSNQDNSGKKRRNWLYYYFIILIVVMLLNTLIFPSVGRQTVTEVSYDQFLNMVNAGQVREVAMDTDEIQFTAVDSNGSSAVYKTGIWDDPALQEELQAAGVTFSKDIPVQVNPILAFLISWILPIGIFLALGYFLSRSMAKRMGGMGTTMSFGKSGAKIYGENETGKTFADVAGQDEAKESLLEIVDFLHNPTKYTDIGANLPKGVLLVGPPGTGKTLLARAVAGEAHVPFFSISGSEFVEMFVGMGAAKVRDLFKQAEEKAPCIVFIDEIDTIGKKRDSVGYSGNDEREQTLNQLLSEMDGFDGRKGVIILAATNRPESLDRALLRPGRFDRRIEVQLPDLQGRIDVLRVHGKDVKLADNVNFEAIARATPGASGADLANIINEGALRAVRNGRNRVTQEDLEESVETVIAGAQKKNAVISPDEKRVVAYHETGHALVAAMLSHSAPVQKITIIPRTSGALGYTMQVEEEEKYLMSKEEALDKICTLTGGRCAEEFIFGTKTSGASNDIEQATKLARSMITQYGMSDQFGMVALETTNNPYLSQDTSLMCSTETAKVIDDEVVGTIKGQHDKAMQILKDNAAKLNEIAVFLLDKETITGDEFMEILNR